MGGASVRPVGCVVEAPLATVSSAAVGLAEVASGGSGFVLEQLGSVSARHHLLAIDLPPLRRAS